MFHVELKVAEVMNDATAIFPNGGGCVIASEDMQPSAQGRRVYLDGSPDIHTVLARVVATGRQMLLSAMTLPGNNGRFWLFADSEGHVVGLHSTA